MKGEITENVHSYVDVVLPLALPKTYTYFLNEEELKRIQPGFRLAVPFGKQKIYTAIAVRIHKVAPQTYEPKPIAMVLDHSPSVTAVQLNFWSWMASYYMCNEGEVMRACCLLLYSLKVKV